MTRQYDMVVLDLDGTLLNSSKLISDGDVNELKSLSSKGVDIVIATGRNFYEAYNLTYRLRETDITIVANNGAIIRHTESFKIIDKNELNDEVFKTIYTMGKARGLYPLVHIDEYDDDNDIVIGTSDDSKSYDDYLHMGIKRYRKVDFDAIQVNDILSICYFGDEEYLMDFSDDIKKKLGDGISTLCVSKLCSKCLLEIQNSNACKFKAVNRLAAKRGITPDRIVAMGDDNNDINLLQNVGLGIAMKNGTEGCKIAAKCVSIYDNDNSGVSYELKRVFY